MKTYLHYKDSYCTRWRTPRTLEQLGWNKTIFPKNALQKGIFWRKNRRKKNKSRGTMCYANDDLILLWKPEIDRRGTLGTSAAEYGDQWTTVATTGWTEGPRREKNRSAFSPTPNHRGICAPAPPLRPAAPASGTASEPGSDRSETSGTGRWNVDDNAVTVSVRRLSRFVRERFYCVHS